MTTAQIKAMRALHEKGVKPNAGTAKSLARMGYMKPTADAWTLTPKGERWITGYVEKTGDGPEDLKAMFRF